MVFEIKYRDLMARIGQIKTKGGSFQTPTLLPVIDPKNQIIPPSDMKREFKCEAIITNAFLIKKNFYEQAKKEGLHDFLNFHGPIMTDSGAYQLLVYGEVDVSSEEIVRVQEEIDTDIAIILDIPSSFDATYSEVENGVKLTIKNAEDSQKQRTRDDILWVGPVQGGVYLDLVKYCAREVGKLDFDLHAIGSVTQLMEKYQFEKLVDLVMAAKQNLPLQRPVHLFGAGHPMMFSLAVAMGIDTFDSAAYSLYARNNRYLTPTGTVRLEELKYDICVCPVCKKNSPQELLEKPQKERETLLARHNLHVSLMEVQTIRQSIIEGTLWELLELRARSHPYLLEALRKLGEYSDFLEIFTPTTKPHAIFYCGPETLQRPEVTRHLKKLETFPQPEETDTLLILLEPKTKPFHKSKEHSEIIKIIKGFPEDQQKRIQIVTKSTIFGLIPLELEEVYPLSQHINLKPDPITLQHTTKTITRYLKTHNYRKVIIQLTPPEEDIFEPIQKVCSEKNIDLHIVRVEEESNFKKNLEALQKILREATQCEK
ncbi:MAG: tRNA guanosine(15) transglycosylase TgtA [Candidatus Freyarchaeota archaeon]|nr:tRNA guanosine(15) transglycosylase TgtA [Candidatus Jordarchaeia archaeon]MBS7268938.1 tRNA guanosine(15) transglycosylase TgtA [Candidatus Jordarchaeia archaeon]MBS7279472.1 tRNA guanosine(15) transglycosylase TgtA [Candidatus Jordarchaeia archaeon]